MFVGYVKAIRLDGGFFYVRLPGSKDVWCHSADIRGELPFDETLLEREVRFDVQQTPKGPRGLNIRAT